MSAAEQALFAMSVEEMKAGDSRPRVERPPGRPAEYTPAQKLAFDHAFRPCAAICGYQVIQTGGDLRLRVTTTGDLPAEQEAGLRRRLAVLHADLEAVALERVDALAQTIAGKTSMIIRR